MDLLWISFLVFQTCLSQYLTKVCTFFLKIFSKNYWGTRVPSPHAGWQHFYNKCNYCHENKIQLMKGDKQHFHRLRYRGKYEFSNLQLILRYTWSFSTSSPLVWIYFERMWVFSNTNRNKFIFCTGCLLKGSRAIQRATSCCN